ncbi:MAG: hypothetical protein ABGY41_04820, partial [Candidatus Poribacteria bacterium]
TIVRSSVAHGSWPRGAADNNTALTLDVAPDATAHDVSVTATVTAGNGGPWEFTYTIAIVALAPEFVLRSSSLFDPEPYGNRDGVANPGERLQARIRLKNIGAGAAENVRVSLSLDHTTAAVFPGAVSHSRWPVGEARNNEGLTLTVATDATARDVVATVDVTASVGGPWRFSMDVPIALRPPDLVQLIAVRGAAYIWVVDPEPRGDGDHLAEPGERVQPRLRLRNSGQLAENVVATLTIPDDPAVTLVSDVITHATWPTGDKRNLVGFAIDIPPDADQDIEAVVRVTADGAGPWEFAFTIPLTLAAAPTALPVPEDVDMDGVVRIHDILAVAAAYYRTGAQEFSNADLDGDGSLGFGDMAIIDAARGDRALAPATRRYGHVSTVERWLSEAARTDDGSPVFRDGMSGLKRLLWTLRPAVSAALPNYPNPFNPETWIPFDLVEAGDVSMRVYDLRGVEVRRIDLGILDAGKYRDRSHAAYWDGRNAVGEPVASGVYIYELRAGDFVARRSMVVRK